MSYFSRRAAWVGGLILMTGLSLAHGAESGAKSRESRSTDALFTNRAIPHLRIEIPAQGIAILRSYEFDREGNGGERTNVLGTVREGTTVYTNVAIHLKGAAGSFRPVDEKPALTLNFDKFASGQRFHGLQKIHLNNSVQDPSFLCEPICRELFLAAGLPTPRAAYATTELNGRDLGLYVLLEGWNKQFLKRHFGNTQGNLYDGGFAKDITNPLAVNSGDNPEDRSDLEGLVTAAQEPDVNDRLARLEQVLDMDRFLTFIAMEVMLAHWDGYAMNKNNYRVFHDLESNRMVFLPHGLDQMFGVWRATPTSSITPQMKGLIAKAVIQTPQGRRWYLERMSQLWTNVFKVETVTARANELAARVQLALAENPAAAANQQRAAMMLRNRIVQRAQSVREQLTIASTPLKFDGTTAAKLSDWEFRRDSGNPAFSRRRGTQELLQISMSGSPGYGSWRTSVLLEEGEYRLVGKVKIEDAAFGPGVTRGGVTLRISGERKARMLTEAADWTAIQYDFPVTGIADVELLCEFRASKGKAWFDIESLKLIRKRGPAKQ
jgi:spore coat protein H